LLEREKEKRKKKGHYVLFGGRGCTARVVLGFLMTRVKKKQHRESEGSSLDGGEGRGVLGHGVSIANVRSHYVIIIHLEGSGSSGEVSVKKQMEGKMALDWGYEKTRRARRGVNWGGFRIKGELAAGPARREAGCPLL